MEVDILSVSDLERKELDHLEALCNRIAATAALNARSVSDLSKAQAKVPAPAFAGGAFAKRESAAGADLRRVEAAIAEEIARSEDLATPGADGNGEASE